MAGRISMDARREVVSAVIERYRTAKRAEKGRILDALCATTGWHRKHAVRALRQHEPAKPVGWGKRGATNRLDAEATCRLLLTDLLNSRVPKKSTHKFLKRLRRRP